MRQSPANWQGIAHIYQKVSEDSWVLYSAYKRPITMKGKHLWWAYIYDRYYDCVICPEYQSLFYRTTNRNGKIVVKWDTSQRQCTFRELISEKLYLREKF